MVMWQPVLPVCVVCVPNREEGGLMHGSTIKLSHTLLTILITAQILLLILEAAVAITQSYVFAVLRTLHSREIY
jgi:sugar/nucleoside kinase (ribokinase family)